MSEYNIKINEENMEWLFTGLEILLQKNPAVQILIDNINKGITKIK